MEKKHKANKAEREETSEEIKSAREEEKRADDKEKEASKLKEELAGYKDKFLRVAAEYENFRKRTEKEKAAIYSDATITTLQSILPVADSLELASQSAGSAGEEYKKGIDMVKTQLDLALSKLGVESFGETGDEFDPNLHNAVSHIDDENEEKENIISSVFQKGYKIGDRVVRHAMVQVTN